MTIIDGKHVAETMREELKKRVSEAKEKGKTVRLAVVIAGNDPASEIYVKNKSKACADVGIASDTVRLPGTVTQEELEKTILSLVEDETVDGVLLQLPLPAHLNERKALALIPARKDVDGFSAENVGMLTLSLRDGNRSCTPHGIIALLDYYKIPIAGKHAVVVGRSNIVGKPMSLMLLSRDATVTICHSKTENLAKYTKDADILVVAVGKANLVTGYGEKRRCGDRRRHEPRKRQTLRRRRFRFRIGKSFLYHAGARRGRSDDHYDAII